MMFSPKWNRSLRADFSHAVKAWSGTGQLDCLEGFASTERGVRAWLKHGIRNTLMIPTGNPTEGT
jgi:hypothetical protein